MTLPATVGHRFGPRWKASPSRGRVTRLIVATALVAGGVLASEPTPAAAEVVDPDLPCPTTAQTATAVAAGFEIDGNCQVNVAGLLDWESPEVGTQPVIKDGLVDSTHYTGGSHETNWPDWTQGGTVEGGRVDIADVYSFSTVSGTQAWGIFAFSRDAGSGAVGYALELNQLPNRSDSPAIPERSVGDWRFNLTQTGNAPLELASCERATTVGPPTVWTAVTCPTGAFVSANSQSQQFVEFAMNLTALTGLAPGCPPEGFSTLNLRSRESPSLTSEMTDFVSGITINPGANCPPVEITTSATADVLLGDPASDTATVTGVPAATPTGTVTFTAFGPFPNAPAPAPDCSGDPVFTSDPVELASGDPGTASATGTFAPTAVGTYFWVASYSGDLNYDPAVTECGAAGETTVVTAVPAITTEATPAVLLGDTAEDTATVAGPAGAPVPTGTVTFTVFGPNDPTCEGEPVFTSPGVPLVDGTATSTPFTASEAGTYLWVVEYSGDSNYQPTTSVCGAAGETTVVHAELAISTSATANVLLGGTATDMATLTVPAGQPAPTGTVTFTLFGPFPSAPEPLPDCSGTAVFTSTVDVIDSTATSGAFTPPQVGTYFWVASYSGDANFEPAVTACGAAGETTVVTATPTLTTSATTPVPLGELASDTATVDAPDGGPTPTGTVTFTVFGPDDPECAGTPVFVSDPVGLTPVDPATATASATATFLPAQVGTYLWVANYSGDAHYEPAATACGDPNETTVVEQVAPAIVTRATPTGPVALGSAIRDRALVDGPAGAATPTGTVTFSLFGPFPTPHVPNPATDCTGDPVFTVEAELVELVRATATATAISGNFTPTAAGTYLWVASYEGDANYEPVSTACGDQNEISVVQQAAPAIATNATPSIELGEAATDTATVTGVPGAATPTGTVTFTVFGPDDLDCSGDPVFTSTVDLATSDPDAAIATATSGPFTPVATGGYLWVAAYSGDASYAAASTACGDDNEATLVPPVTPAITTNATPDIELGGTASDTATVAGVPGASPPTGTVTFTVFGPDDPDCSGDPVFTSDPVDLTETEPGTAIATTSFTPTAAGTYLWVAAYEGDANYEPVSTACGDDDETTVVQQATPAIATNATPSIELGEAATDTATVTGVPGAAAPTGTVVFTVFGPDDPDCSGDPVFTSTVDLATSDPDTATATATSGPFTPTVPGGYLWVANYSGDANYLAASTSCGDENEATLVPPVTPTITTNATPTIALGETASDTATVAGASGALPPTGTVTFTVFGPDDPDCSGDPVFTSDPVDLTETEPGTATATATASFTPTAPGGYLWVAAYSGDAIYEPVSTACGDENEATLVPPVTPTITTNATPDIELGETANDTATVTGVPGALPPTGTVTFTVFGPDDPDCSGGPVFTSDPVDLTGTEPGTATATTSFTPTAPGTYLWVAAYSGDAIYEAVSTACGDPNETTVVTAPPEPPTPPTPPTPPQPPTPPTPDQSPSRPTPVPGPGLFTPPVPPGLLPVTGADAARTLLVAVALVTFGSGLVAWRRRILGRR